jgi:hypothetical protein
MKKEKSHGLCRFKLSTAVRTMSRDNHFGNSKDNNKNSSRRELNDKLAECK